MKNFLGSFSLPDVNYHRPDDIPEALERLREHSGQCMVIAGCTDVIPMIRRGTLDIRPETHLVDVTGIDAMTAISVKAGTVSVGAAAPYSSIIGSPVVSECNGNGKVTGSGYIRLEIKNRLIRNSRWIIDIPATKQSLVRKA